MSASVLQVFSLGLIWTSVHCVGMCGPIVAGVASMNKDASTFEKIVSVLKYQGGRAVAYALFGILTGSIGTIIDTRIFPYASFATAMFFIFFGLRRLSGRSGNPSEKIVTWYTKVFRFARGKSPFIIGFALSIMPCSITLWALGLAASSGDPLTGMWTMLALVLITSPVLLIAGSASALASKFGSDKIIGLLLIISGIWIGAKALADLGFIGHLAFHFRVFNEPYGIMLF